MSEQVWFIPGQSGILEGPLARYRPRQSVGAAAGYVRTFTSHGDLVVDLFCRGPTIVREAVVAGRRALGFSVNPLLLATARLGLSQPNPAALNAAFTQLADSPKGDVPLRVHLTSLYRSACPDCGTPGTAEWFAWDRDGHYPFEKAVRCPRCEEVQRGPPDDRDAETARRISPRGLAYYYALDRAAPPDHPARERAAELVECYTPRNLSALMDLSRRLEGLEADETVKTALTAVLIDCFDAGSKLDPYGEERARPRTLRIPSRYLERNIWLCFEEAFSRLLNRKPPLLGPQAEEVGLLVQGRAEGYALVASPAREVKDILPPTSAALIFADPPRPDGVFWALSALWAGWLWESPAARAMRPFLRRRRFDWDWHWRALRTALKAVGPLLTSEGHLITLFTDPNGTLLESVCLAASSAGYALEGWGCAPGGSCRLVWRWERTEAPSPTDVKALKHDLTAASETSIVKALRERGEPSQRSLLRASACAELTKRSLLARVAAVPEGEAPALALAADAVDHALSFAPTLRVGDQEEKEKALRWLAEPSQALEPLADRVEVLVWKLLQQQPAWDQEELISAVYAHFTGPLTPEPALVQTCIESYSVEENGVCRLRPEDDPERRKAELKEVHRDLAGLGKRLGFSVRRGRPWDVRWLEERREEYVFATSVTAVLGPHLLVERPAAEGVQRCLVVPGGRARLVSQKLQRDPRLAQAVEADGWQFIKFRHLRRLIAEEELDRYALKTVLGLDPLAEQEAAQIPLF